MHGCMTQNALPLPLPVKESDMATNEILIVNKIGRADGDYGCYCPHCGEPMFFSDDELEDIRGSQTSILG